MDTINQLYIVYGVIIVIAFFVWYYMSKNYITENVQESCKTGEDKSSDIFWGVVIRYIISIVVAYALFILYGMFFVKKN